MRIPLIDTVIFDPKPIGDLSYTQKNPGLILESETKSGIMYVGGILQKANVKNANGRIYPKAVLQEQIVKYKNLVKERAAHGELDHPDSSVISLKNISHTVVDIGWDGDDVVGVIEILDGPKFPSGNILRGMFERKLKVGISSRGVGSVEEINEDTVKVKDDFEIICWDFVSNPSTPGAWMTPKNYNNGVNEGTTLLESNLKNVSDNKLKLELKEWKWKKANSIMTDIICEIGGYCEC